MIGYSQYYIEPRQHKSPIDGAKLQVVSGREKSTTLKSFNLLQAGFFPLKVLWCIPAFHNTSQNKGHYDFLLLTQTMINAFQVITKMAWHRISKHYMAFAESFTLSLLPKRAKIKWLNAFNYFSEVWPMHKFLYKYALGLK